MINCLVTYRQNAQSLQDSNLHDYYLESLVKNPYLLENPYLLSESSSQTSQKYYEYLFQEHYKYLFLKYLDLDSTASKRSATNQPTDFFKSSLAGIAPELSESDALKNT